MNWISMIEPLIRRSRRPDSGHS